MDRFTRIVSKCKHLHELGEHIIRYKNSSNNIPSTMCISQHIEHENRIRKFIQISESLHKEWDENDYSINKYWVGLS